ncbi:MAG TPA: PAS domain-containing protein [Candidatus Thermoplasmatota archaeon]
MASLGPRPRDLRVPSEDEVRRRLTRTTGLVFVTFLAVGWVVMVGAAQAFSSFGAGVTGSLLLMAYGGVLGYLLWRASLRELALIRTLSIFVGEAPVAVAFLDERGHVTYANQSLERMTGLKLADLTDTSAARFVHADDRPRVAREVERRARGESGSYELRIVGAGGRELKTVVFALPFFDGDRYDGSLAAIVDLTELHAARESAEKYRGLASFALDVVTHDLSNAMQMVNSRAELAALSLPPAAGDARRAVQAVVEAAGRSSRLLVEVKQIAAAEREEWPKREVEVADLVDRAIALAVTAPDVTVDTRYSAEAAALTIQANDLSAIALAKLVEEASEPGMRRKTPHEVGLAIAVEGEAAARALVFRVTGSTRAVGEADLITLRAAPREAAAADTPWRSGVRVALAAAVAEAQGWALRAVRGEKGAEFELHVPL